MKNIILLLSITLCISISFSCREKQISTTPDDLTIKKFILNNDTAWKYYQEYDNMTSQTDYFARLGAKQIIYFESPYDGGSFASITVRNKNKENEVLLRVSPSQFTSETEVPSIRIRFDDEQPIRYYCDEPSDGSTDVLFMKESEEIIRKLEKSKKILIEVEFYQQGIRQIEFNCSGFIWANKYTVKAKK